MRRKEREQAAVGPAMGAAASLASDAESVQENSAVKMGAEAFVAKNGSGGYGQPDWESDETLEAYLSS